MSLPRYPKYKDSGVEWLGEVPEHWELSKIKHVFEFRSGGTPSKSNLSYWDGDVPWASSKDLKTETLTDTVDHITEKAVADGASLLEPGTLLVVVRGMILAHSFPVTKALVPMAINQDLKGLTTRDGWHVDYAAYALRASAPETFRRLDEAGHGTKALRMEAWGGLEVPRPTMDEQVTVAGFLDGETAKIDALVAEQERLIELLQDKRQAVISHAVTKGLNPDAPMKDSGIDWMGTIPAHWQAKRVKSTSVFTTSGPRGWSERIGEAGAVFVQSGDLDDMLGVNFEDAKRVVVTAEAKAEAARTRLLSGDVVVCITGAKTGNVGVCIEASEDAYVNQHLCLVRPTSEILPMFLALALKCDLGQTHFALSQYGLKQGLSLEDVREAPVFVPGILEQVELVRFAEREAQRIDGLVAEARHAIELLQERRTALISAAVTGQIDVRPAASRRSA